MTQIFKPIPLATLQGTFKKLRKPKPQLALTIQNAMVAARPAANQHQRCVTLAPGSVQQIVQFLSDLNSQLSSSPVSDGYQLANIRTLLLDWLYYAQSLGIKTLSSNINQAQSLARD